MTRIESEMKRKGLTAYAAAKAVGTQPVKIYNWITGRTSPSLRPDFLAFTAWLRANGIAITAEKWNEYVEGK